MVGLGNDGSQNDIIRGACYIIIMGAFYTLLELSYSLFLNFNIKENHKFNKMTIGIFFGDLVKKFLLFLIIGGPIYYAIMSLIEWGGPHFYIYLIGFMLVALVLLVNLVPNLIMPLFNKYTDLE